MTIYHLMHGVEHDEDNSVSAEHVTVFPINYGPTYADALESLTNCIKIKGNRLAAVSGWLFAHIPGVEGVFEEYSVGDNQQVLQIWLIRSLTP